MKSLLNPTTALYDTIKNFWESIYTQKLISNFLVLSFILGIVFYGLVKVGFVNPAQELFNHPFFAIEISFTLLLIFELFSLIFALPRSVAKSNSKQYELLSLIFLRSGFKEFSHIDNLSDWSLNSEPVLHMFAYGLGGLVIFVLISFTYRLQKHVKITTDENQQKRFIEVKKLLALFLLIAFLIIGILDLVTLFETGIYSQSFETFYTTLIFSDILIVLIALRYSTAYIRIFRYSAFALATIFIRISFSLDTYQSVLVGVLGALFVLLLTYSYNHFLSNTLKSLDYNQK